MLLGLACFSFGCSSFDGGLDVAVPMLQTTPESAAPGTDWSCLGAPPAAAPVVLAQGQARVVYSVQMVDLATRQVPHATKARGCVLTDVECTQPVTPWLDIDAQGWIDLSLYQGFVGYIEFVTEGYVPGSLYLTEPLEGSQALAYPLFALSLDSLGALAATIGLKADSTLGFISLRAFDCKGVTAPGVVFSKTGAGDAWYFADGLPTRLATQTGGEGFGGFANIPPGQTSVDALTPSGTSISGAHSFVIRPGWFSSANIAPPGAQLQASPTTSAARSGSERDPSPTIGSPR